MVGQRFALISGAQGPCSTAAAGAPSELLPGALPAGPASRAGHGSRGNSTQASLSSSASIHIDGGPVAAGHAFSGLGQAASRGVNKARQPLTRPTGGKQHAHRRLAAAPGGTQGVVESSSHQGGVAAHGGTQGADDGSSHLPGMRAGAGALGDGGAREGVTCDPDRPLQASSFSVDLEDAGPGTPVDFNDSLYLQENGR